MASGNDNDELTTYAIEIEGLRVRRGGRLVLPDLSTRVPSGLVTGLLGPSGSGKTTLMRAIVGVQTVEGGRLTVLGRPAGVADLRRRVAYVTQAPSVYLDLTLEENLRFFASVVGASPRRVEEVVDLVGLRGQVGQVTGTFSGGERSRASLAVALLGEPELLVLDEPTVGIDPTLRRELWAMFHELAARGTALLVSTHVMDEATRCDELLLMREGRIVATGSPEALLARSGADNLEDAFLSLAAQP